MVTLFFKFHSSLLVSKLSAVQFFFYFIFISIENFHNWNLFFISLKSVNNSLNSTCMLSLNNRPLNVSNGTLLVSLSDGRIQVWSHHHNAARNITDFNAIHVAGDVSKWLIDVHFACWSWCIHSFSPFFLSRRFLISACSFRRRSRRT